jgi:hypothetical protein
VVARMRGRMVTSCLLRGKAEGSVADDLARQSSRLQMASDPAPRKPKPDLSIFGVDLGLGAGIAPAICIRVSVRMVTAIDMAKAESVDPKAFRQALRDEGLPWHAWNERWEVVEGSKEHADMQRVMAKLTAKGGARRRGERMTKRSSRDRAIPIRNEVGTEA